MLLERYLIHIDVGRSENLVCVCVCVVMWGHNIALTILPKVSRNSKFASFTIT